MANVGFSQITVVFFLGWYIGMDPNLDNKKKWKNILEGDRSPFATCFFLEKKGATNQPQSPKKKTDKTCVQLSGSTLHGPPRLFAVCHLAELMGQWDLQSHDNTGWWFQIFLMFIPIWGRFPFWRAYFSIGWFNHHLWNVANVFFGVIISEWLLYLVVELDGLLFELFVT